MRGLASSRRASSIDAAAGRTGCRPWLPDGGGKSCATDVGAFHHRSAWSVAEDQDLRQRELL